jgi:serine/threonine protein kinase
MTPERWQQIKVLIQDALELPVQQRSRFLAEACTDDLALRQEVESFLALDDQEVPTGILKSLASRVALPPGTRLGDYEVNSLLGVGGMGEVYRARDARLGRDVAIKVLPALLSHDEERLRRFEQEARAAAVLNHPNILAVFQMGMHAGAPYIVSELLEGGTLREQLMRGPISFRKTMDFGVQIARGLAAAHEKGIVHRDLKPENLFITRDGRVKILDFGLAKLTQPQLSSDSSGPTLTHGTEPGMVMGTVGYMSPEQVSGRKTDHRTDIFAFGAILYEMLTGKRAFQKPTSAETMSAILNEEPPGISQMVQSAPPALQRIVQRCLEKNPEQRFQSASDLGFALEALSDSDGYSGTATVQLRPSRGPVWILSGLTLLLLVLAGVAWWLVRAPTTAPAPSLTLTRLTSDSGLTTDPTFSSDGKLLAYASDRSGEGNLDIYVKQVGGGEPHRLTRGPGDKHEPTFSPDGTTIAFRSEQEGSDGIYVVSALGGTPRKIVSEGDQPQFSPDGNWLTYSLQLGLCYGTRDLCRIFIVPSGGGEARQLRPEFAAALYVVWSPDGKHLLFLGDSDEKLPEEESFDWYVTPLDSGPAIKTGALEATRNAKLLAPISPSSSTPRWILDAPVWQPSGDALVFSARSGDSTNLWRIGISAKNWKVTGTPQRLTSGAAKEEAPSVASGPGGIVRLGFASLTDNSDIWSLPLDPNQGRVTGKPTRLTQDAAADFHPALSPDGNKMVWVSARSGSQEIWIKDLQTGEDSMLTATRSDKWHPRFSPDSSKVIFGDGENLYIMPVTGGAPEMVCEGCGEATDWSHDGKRILGDELKPHAWVLELATRHRTDLLATHHGVTGVFSPDNRWVLFADTATARTYVAPFGELPIPESTWIPIVENWWDWDWYGDLIYSTSDRDGFTCIWAHRLDATTRRPVGAPFPVFHAHSARISLANQGEVYLSVGRDKMLFNMTERTGNIWMAEWKDH